MCWYLRERESVESLSFIFSPSSTFVILVSVVKRCNLSHSLFLSLPHSHTHTHTLSLSHTHTHTYTLSLTLSLCLTLYFYLSHTHTHTHILSLSFSFYLSPPFNPLLLQTRLCEPGQDWKEGWKKLKINKTKKNVKTTSIQTSLKNWTKRTILKISQHQFIKIENENIVLRILIWFLLSFLEASKMSFWLRFKHHTLYWNEIYFLTFCNFIQFFQEANPIKNAD